MKLCLFASDLHGNKERYEKLFQAIVGARPMAVFLGGDLLPSPWILDPGEDFLRDFLAVELCGLRELMGDAYPKVLLILGNDDGKVEEDVLLDSAFEGLWHYAHGRHHTVGSYSIYGYSYVPPTPFRLKDWEKYDVGRYVPHGCVSPEEGVRTVEVSEHESRYGTIAKDLDRLIANRSLDRTVLLVHSPPYDTKLDRAALDDMSVDHVPFDVHVGSIALRRLIEERQPYVTLHGHVHESARLTGSWHQRLGRTYMFGAAHDGPELALVRFDLDEPALASRLLI